MARERIVVGRFDHQTQRDEILGVRLHCRSSEQKEARDKIMAQLTALYKNVHNNSDSGLNELIAGVLSKPMP